MTREEMQAVVETVLDEPRTVPGRADTILRAVDHYTAAEVSAAYDQGYQDGFADAADLAKAGELP